MNIEKNVVIIELDKYENILSNINTITLENLELKKEIDKMKEERKNVDAFILNKIYNNSNYNIRHLIESKEKNDNFDITYYKNNIANEFMEYGYSQDYIEEKIELLIKKYKEQNEEE